MLDHTICAEGTDRALVVGQLALRLRAHGFGSAAPRPRWAGFFVGRCATIRSQAPLAERGRGLGDPQVAGGIDRAARHEFNESPGCRWLTDQVVV